MNAGSVWQILGLATTRDLANIRRAYARLLRTTSPEDDPEGFQELRWAYESAMAYARVEAQIAVTSATSQGRGDTARSSVTSAFDEAEAQPSDRPLEAVDLGFGLALDDRQDQSRLTKDRRAHHAARYRLAAAVTAPSPVEPSDLVARFDEVLAFSVLEEVGVYTETEQWLADLIAANAPRSDPLLGPACARFRWDENERSLETTKAVRRVLARRHDLRFLEERRERSHPEHLALVALSHQMHRPLSFGGMLSPMLAQQVGVLLKAIRVSHPSLIADLDPLAVIWWDDYFKRPHLSPWVLWFIVLAPIEAFLVIVVRSAWSVTSWFETSTVLMAGGLAFALACLYGVVWPRILWRTRWVRSAPSWLRHGWAPTTAAVIIAASVAPATRITALALTMLAIGLGLWVIITGEPNRQPIPNNRSQFRGQTHWLFSAAINAPPFLLIWWLIVGWSIPRMIFWPMTSLFAVGLIASIWGAMSLTQMWRDVVRGRNRWLVLPGMVVVLIVSAILVCGAGDHPDLRPPALACVAVAVLVAKVSVTVTGIPTPLLNILARFHFFVLYFGALGVAVTAFALSTEGASILSAFGAMKVLIVGGGILIFGLFIAVGEIFIDGRGSQVR